MVQSIIVRCFTCSIITFCLTSLCVAQDATETVEAAGGTILKISQESDDLEVSFHLSDKEITDESLKGLENVKPIVWLNLANTKISDEGLATVGKITTLTKLHLEKTEIGDEGLKHLSGLEELEYLNIYSTKVTDAGLEHLKPLKKLRRLYVWQSQVTDDGIKKLGEQMPDLTVIGGAKMPVVEEKKEGEGEGK